MNPALLSLSLDREAARNLTHENLLRPQLLLFRSRMLTSAICVAKSRRRVHLAPKPAFLFQGYSLPFRPEQQQKQPSKPPTLRPTGQGYHKGFLPTTPPTDKQHTQNHERRVSRPHPKGHKKQDFTLTLTAFYSPLFS
jgi:hypothetical protein